jgi:hypothetical protein
MKGYVCVGNWCLEMRSLSVTAAFLFRSLSILVSGGSRVGACSSREGYISRAVFFMYPYVLIAGPNKHDNLLDCLCRRNAKLDSLRTERGNKTNITLYRDGKTY